MSTPMIIDNRMISGDLDVAVTALGVQPAAQSRVLQDPTLKENADNPLAARIWYTSINPTVPPLNNIECRKAIHVRHGPHRLPDCIRWPVCGWGSGNDRSCRRTFPAIRLSICTRTVKTQG